MSGSDRGHNSDPQLMPEDGIISLSSKLHVTKTCFCLNSSSCVEI